MAWSVHNSLEVTVMCQDYILSSKMRFKPAMTVDLSSRINTWCWMKEHSSQQQGSHWHRADTLTTLFRKSLVWPGMTGGVVTGTICLEKWVRSVDGDQARGHCRLGQRRPSSGHWAARLTWPIPDQTTDIWKQYWRLNNYWGVPDWVPKWWVIVILCCLKWA